MARTKIKPNGTYSAYDLCPKVMLKNYLEKQKWFIAALGSFGTGFMEKTEWEIRYQNKNVPGSFLGNDPYELRVIMKHEDVDINIQVQMDDAQGFEIRMGHRMEARRNDGSLVVWYSNNVEGAAERVKRHYEQHGIPYAEKEKEQVKARKEKEEKRINAQKELEEKVGCSFAKERYGQNFVYEQGTFGITFRYSKIERHEGYPEDMVGQQMVKVKSVNTYFTPDEFKEFLEWMSSRPRFVAERLVGKRSSLQIEGRD